MIIKTIPSKSVFSLLLIVLSLVVLLLVDQTSVCSYVYTLGLLYCICRVFCKEYFYDVFLVFHLYLLIAVILTSIFKYQFPDYLGLTGMEGVYGTDDARYYAQIVGGNVGYTVQVSVIDIFAYSKLLDIVYPFHVYTPLNIIIVNLLTAVYIPVLVHKLSLAIFEDTQIADTASIWTVLCPFTVYFSCIIMRESFIVTMVLAGLYCFIKNRFFLLIIPIVAIVIIRFGSIVFLLGGIIIVSREKMRSNFRYGNILFFTMLMLLVAGAFFFFSYHYPSHILV